MLGAALLAAGCGRGAPASVGIERIPVDYRVVLPPIAGPTLGGGSADLGALGGRIVVLNSWASWCEPCRAEVPVLVAQARTSGPDVAFVGLNVSDEPAAARGFVAETGMDYPSIVDRDGALLATIPGVPARALPSTVLIDPEGRIAARVIGEVSAGDLAVLIAELQSEQSA